MIEKLLGKCYLSPFSVLTALEPEQPQGCYSLLMPGTVVKSMFTKYVYS